MSKKFLLLIICGYGSLVYGQDIQDPVANRVSQDRADGSYFSGRIYYKWVVDINHDGINDVLLGQKETPDEIKQEEAVYPDYDSDNQGFSVYIGLKKGGYVTDKPVEGTLYGDTGITVNISECYVGYIQEIKRYGIVTVETRVVDDPKEPQARHGVTRKQVCCYTVEKDHLKRTNLTALYDPNRKNPIYDKYLSESKRTKIQLQEVKP